MADRYGWEREFDQDRDRDREREGGGRRWDWDRGREWNRYGEGRYEEPRYGEGRFEEPSREYRGEGWGRGNYGRENWGRERWERDRPWSGENRSYVGSERFADYGDPGDWGRQGSWGTFGNRPDWNRESSWREEFGPERGRRRNQWGQGTGLYGGGMGTYSGGIGTYGERGRFTGRGPKGWQRSDDRIRDDINERLTDHPNVDATEIEVRVTNGEVTLTGSVDDRHSKRIAEDIAEGVSGVKDVHNQLRVQSQYAGQTTSQAGHQTGQQTTPGTAGQTTGSTGSKRI